MGDSGMVSSPERTKLQAVRRASISNTSGGVNDPYVLDSKSEILGLLWLRSGATCLQAIESRSPVMVDG